MLSCSEGFLMTATQTDIAADYRSLLDKIITAVEGCSAEQWQTVTAPEGWSVGVVAHHVATTQQFMIHLLENVIAGSNTLTQVTMEQVHAGNAQHAREFANVGKAETLTMLRDDSSRTVALIAQLTNDQLDAPAAQFDGHSVSLSQCIDSVAINHFREHLASITEAIKQ
jgi:hypothetical protein